VTNTFLPSSSITHIYICIYLCTNISRRFATEPSSPSTASLPRDQSPRCGSLRDQYLCFNRPITYICIYVLYLRGASLSRHRRHHSHLRFATGVQGAAPYVTNTLHFNRPITHISIIYLYVSIYAHTFRGSLLPRHRHHQPHLRPATGVQGTAPYVTNTFLSDSP